MNQIHISMDMMKLIKTTTAANLVCLDVSWHPDRMSVWTPDANRFSQEKN
jgi:hypothetical protein